MKQGDIVEVITNPRAGVKSTQRYVGEPATIISIINERDKVFLIQMCDSQQLTVELGCIGKLGESKMSAAESKVENQEVETTATAKPQYTGPIKLDVSTRAKFTGGRDYIAPTALIVPSTFKDADDTEKSVYILQDKQGVSVSLETLERICKWARGEK
jgi:hypothetical protein